MADKKPTSGAFTQTCVIKGDAVIHNGEDIGLEFTLDSRSNLKAKKLEIYLLPGGCPECCQDCCHKRLKKFIKCKPQATNDEIEIDGAYLYTSIDLDRFDKIAVRPTQFGTVKNCIFVVGRDNENNLASLKSCTMSFIEFTEN
nr:hypothetical protein [Abalone asfa-like virus]